MNDLNILSSEFKEGALGTNLIMNKISTNTKSKKEFFYGKVKAHTLYHKYGRQDGASGVNFGNFQFNPSKSFNDDGNEGNFDRSPAATTKHNRSYYEVDNFASSNLVAQSKRDLSGRLGNYDTLQAPDGSSRANTPNSQNSSA